MCSSNKDNNFCYLLTLISSILGAIGIAAVFYTGLITSVIALAAVTLVFGIFSLIALIVLLYCKMEEGCYCIDKNCLITTMVGSIITSIFALTITSLATLSIPVAILIGAVAFFLISNLIALIKTIICVICLMRCR
jgi:hypothetical protein